MQSTDSEPRGVTRVIRSKLRPPQLSDAVVERPRLRALVRELVDANPVLSVVATPGAGKTTAVVQALAGDPRLGWLTLDDGDIAPGRLLVYLEAALAEVAPATAGVVGSALTDGVGLTEAAGLLAEASAGAAAILVVDDVERIADVPAAAGILQAFVRYAPRTLHLVLVSRRDVALGRDAAASTTVEIGERDLAFTVPEATDALGALTSPSPDIETAVVATAGWVTGVLFEAWRSGAHVQGSGGEADPLRNYLSSQILDQLTEAERDLLILTSPLRRVDAETASRLGIVDAETTLDALRQRRLPATWEAQGHALRCHPRFREVLAELLLVRGEAVAARQRRLHGELLRDDGLDEEAADELFVAGAIDAALPLAERAVGGVVERLDLDVADRWVRQLPDDRRAEHPRLLTAELVVAIGREEWRRGVRAARELLAGPHAATLPPRTQSLVAWAFWIGGEPQLAREVARRMPPGPERRVTRYQLSVGDNDPSPERDDPPHPTGSPLDGVLMRTNVITGRLRAVRDAPPTRWSSVVAEPWRIETARALGRLNEARERLDSALASEAVALRLRGLVAPRVLGDLGRVEEALSVLEETRPQLSERGSFVWDVQSLLLECRLRLRHDLDPDHARAILGALHADPELQQYAFLSEEATMWRGLAAMLADDREARDLLRRAVDSMVAGRRAHDLPAAAVYLAEAAWRSGDEADADAAADIALDAAHRQASNHALLQALADFPGVLIRRLDAEPDADSEWHALGRVLAARSVDIGRSAGRRVRFHDLGAPRLVVDGETVRPPITKSLEVLAYLSSVPDQRTTRAALMHAVFDGRSDHAARTYLRQALHKLRDTLPEDVDVVLDDDGVTLSGITVATDSERFAAMLEEATRSTDADQLELLERAIELYETGEYLAGRSSVWIDERRGELGELAGRARLDAAELRFAANDIAAAQAHLDAALAVDPFREGAWRLAMQIAAAYGDGDRVIAVYRRCERALAELGIEPSPATRQLLVGLRR